MDSVITERFWAKVNKTDTCWLWTGAQDNYGYGKVKIKGRVYSSHRVSYSLLVEEIPKGLVIDHTCHVPNCVNPNHLRPVTYKQNLENKVGANRNSKSGVRGVWWHEGAGKWEAQVIHNRKTHYVGYFKTLEEATAAVTAKRNQLFTHNDADKALLPLR